jgi:uncharacterized protein YndB with AHSA1/START domain
MTHITTTLEIERSQPETFDYLTDLKHAPEWSTEVIEVRYDGELAAGSTGADVRRFGKRTIEMPWKVTAFERPERIVFEYGPPFPATSEFTFSPSAHGTSVTCDTDLRPRGLWRLLTPMLARESRHNDEVQFARAKEILEARSLT